MSWFDNAGRIRAVVLDVDGVLTDGRVGLGAGQDETKFFDVRDGHAIKLLRRAGLRVGMLSGRTSPANRRCAEELGLDFLFQGEKDKLAAFERLCVEQGLDAAECLYIGDDLVDLPVLRRAGIGVAVADAAEEVRERVEWVTAARGGRGAVREVAVALLKRQGRWDELVARYLR
jgi:3-deoxy-D-manno-octulosonate 8-phosphate phosphatase (KDO 8-P phosphatase)